MSLVTPDVIVDEVETQTDVAVEAKTEEVIVEKTEVAVQEQNAEVAVAKPNNTELRQATTSQFLSAQADAGFEGLDIGAFSFERVKLDEGQFLMGADDIELGTAFNFVALSTRSLYIIRQNSTQDAEMYYSYCPKGSTKADGSSAEETLNEWKEDGYGDADNPLDIKKYLEVMAELTDRDDEYEGMMVSLSIPPSSLQRFGGMAFQASRKFGRTLDQVVIKATVGAKAGEGSKSFRPWNFKIDRSV